MSVLEPAATRLLTAEEFLARSGDDRQAELINGEVGEGMAAGYRHGELAARIAFAMMKASGTASGTTGADTAFIVHRDPDTVLVPDVGYVRPERLPNPRPAGFLDLVPDLVVEVVSPSDRAGAVAEKALEWVAAGVLIAVVVWPDDRTVWVCRPDHAVTTLEGDAILTCPDLLPGFELPLPELFA